MREQKTKGGTAREKMEIMVPGENRTEAERMMDLLATMSEEEKREMLTFMKGVEFGRQMAATTGPAA